MKGVCKHQDLPIFVLKLNKYFQSLEVVDRGSETQPQVAADLNQLT